MKSIVHSPFEREEPTAFVNDKPPIHVSPRGASVHAGEMSFQALMKVIQGRALRKRNRSQRAQPDDRLSRKKRAQRRKSESPEDGRGAPVIAVRGLPTFTGVAPMVGRPLVFLALVIALLMRQRGGGGRVIQPEKAPILACAFEPEGSSTRCRRSLTKSTLALVVGG
jgi:hypothetical protein